MGDENVSAMKLNDGIGGEESADVDWLEAKVRGPHDCDEGDVVRTSCETLPQIQGKAHDERGQTHCPYAAGTVGPSVKGFRWHFEYPQTWPG